MKPEEVKVINRPDVGEEVMWQVGELYLFAHHAEPNRQLWAVFSEWEQGCVVAESATEDFRSFNHWVRLAPVWCYRRMATRAELRDYSYALAVYELSHRS